jgi:hypothetical protein
MLTVTISAGVGAAGEQVATAVTWANTGLTAISAMTLARICFVILNFEKVTEIIP